MPIVPTADLRPDTPLSVSENLQVYNGLDCCITTEGYNALEALSNQNSDTYNYELALQGPMLEIMLRGFKVDETSRRQAITELQTRLRLLNEILEEFAQAVWDKPLNPRSREQLLAFFYGTMHLPEIWSSKKGVRKLSMDRETLEKLDIYFHARPIIATILAIRDCSKQIETLSTKVDDDGRMRTSYNIAGTETWRLSSSKSAEWTGGNLQNITPDLRYIFTADYDEKFAAKVREFKSKKLCVIDLEQAESREVGWLCWILFGDPSYLDACEAGDLHTIVCRGAWKKLAWTGDNKADRKIAEMPAYRHLSYRDLAKKLGHGSNYYGQPFTMARHAKLVPSMVEEFQKEYFSSFPGIQAWHQWTATQIQTTHSITTPFGLTRHFFGRPNEDTTLREAIAFSPQCSTAIRTNLWLLRTWERFGNWLQLLAQTHDSLTFQYDEEMETEIIPSVLSILSEIKHVHNGRTFTVPGEAKTGWNWMAHHNESKPIGPGNRYNPNGLKKWTGKPDGRERITGLQRTF